MDLNLLDYEIKKNGYTTKTFCEAVGISKSAFSRKRNRHCEFTVPEIKKIAEVLHLDIFSVVPIFFAD